jgi:hypothetical protein
MVMPDSMPSHALGSAAAPSRLARYSAIVAATGASTLAHAAIVNSGAGVVATVNTTTAQQGFTSGPGGTTWHRTTNTQVFAVNGRNFSIQAFNQRTIAVPRLMGGAFGGTAWVGVGGPSGTPIEINKLASGAVVGGGATTFLRRSFYGGLPLLGQRFDQGVFTANPPVGAAQPGVNGPVTNTGNFIVSGTATPTGEIRGYVGFRLTNLAGGVSTMYGYFDVGYNWTTNTVTVYSWSYDDTGNPITIGPPSAVPGGAGLAALAFGAAGLRGRRRSRN